MLHHQGQQKLLQESGAGCTKHLECHILIRKAEFLLLGLVGVAQIPLKDSLIKEKCEGMHCSERFTSKIFHFPLGPFVCLHLCL